MLIGIHQLHYLPWLRYFHKMASCDVFIVLDHIQFNKNGWQNRNKIKTPEGASLLTVPVYHENAQRLDQVRIDNKNPWRRKHWGSLSTHYRKAPFFGVHEGFFARIYGREWEFLNEVNREILEYCLKALGICTRILWGSQMHGEGEATQRLVSLCREAGGTAYLTGAFAAEAYLDAALFDQAGIRLQEQSFTAPVYTQRYPQAGFIPELSIVDLLFNCGPESFKILMSGASCGKS